MSANTKIVVLHMKELIYTIIFLCFGILLVFLLFFMFGSQNPTQTTSSDLYQPGVYTSSLTLSNASLEVEVTVDSDQINSIRFSNLDETITTAYPLIQPTMEDIAIQVCESQSLENITYTEDNMYTSQVIAEAIQVALDKASLD